MVINPASKTTKLNTPAKSGRLRKTSITDSSSRRHSPPHFEGGGRLWKYRQNGSPFLWPGRGRRSRPALSLQRPSIGIPRGQERVRIEAAYARAIRVDVPGVEKIENRHLLRDDTPDLGVHRLASSLAHPRQRRRFEPLH